MTWWSDAITNNFCCRWFKTTSDLDGYGTSCTPENRQIFCHPYSSPMVPQIHQPSILSRLTCSKRSICLLFSLFFLTLHLMFTRFANWTLSSFLQACPEAARALLSAPMRGTAFWLFLAMRGTPGQGIPGFPQNRSSGQQSLVAALSETPGGWTLISRSIGHFSLWFPFVIVSFTGSDLSFPTSSHHRRLSTCAI